MKVIIIEDEKLSAQHAQMLLHKIDADIEIICTIDSVQQSIALFKNGLTADLILLDIHLADGLSFEIFNHISIDIPIIFTTAYNQYAIQAFQVNSIDYLLKPIAIDDLIKAIEKFKKFASKISGSQLQNMMQNYQANAQQTKSRFLVKLGQTIESIKTEDVHYFTTIDSISFLVCANGKKYPVDYTLDVLETLVAKESFFRINRKILLHISAIKKVNTFFNSRLSITALHLDGETSIVSRERVSDFKAWLDR